MVVLEDDLGETPAEGLSATGIEGGPFEPESKIYTLTNRGTSEIHWSATSTQSWVTVLPSGGALAAGASVSATATIASAANGLSVGSYGGIITFSNRSSGAVQRRGVSLQVVPHVIYTFALIRIRGGQPRVNGRLAGRWERMAIQPLDIRTKRLWIQLGGRVFERDAGISPDDNGVGLLGLHEHQSELPALVGGGERELRPSRY